MAQLIDAPQTQLDKTVRVFDKFYNFDLRVDANEYDLVYSYFYEISKSKDVASNFSTIIFRISNLTGEDPLVLLKQLENTTNFKSSALLTYYLNSTKSKTTLYGVGIIPQPNELIQRNIVA